MEEALAPASNFAIRLPVFEGPLDLLLYLIRRNEVDIYDIPMEKVTRQYIDTIHSMETLDLEVAGEFFVMASTLMYIKSRMLLPPKDQGPDQDIEEDIPPVVFPPILLSMMPLGSLNSSTMPSQHQVCCSMQVSHVALQIPAYTCTWVVQKGDRTI